MESGIQNKLVAELYLPIPEPSHVSGRIELESFDFSSDQQVFYKHDGVGSGEWFRLYQFFHNQLAMLERSRNPNSGTCS